MRNYFYLCSHIVLNHSMYFSMYTQTQNTHGIYCSVTFDCRRNGIPQAQRHSNLFLLASFVVVHVRLASRDLDNLRSWWIQQRRFQSKDISRMKEREGNMTRQREREREKNSSFVVRTVVSSRASFPNEAPNLSCLVPSAYVGRWHTSKSTGIPQCLPLNFRVHDASFSAREQTLQSKDNLA